MSTLATLYKRNKSLLLGAGLVAFVSGLGIGLQFVLNWQVADQFGAEEAGLFFIAFTLISVVSMIGRLGLDIASLRIVSPLYEKGNIQAVREIKKRLTLLVFLAAALLGFLTYVLSPWLASSVFSAPELERHFQFAALAIPSFALTFLNSELLRATKRTALSVATRHVFVFLAASLLVAALAIDVIDVTRLFMIASLIGWIASEVLFYGLLNAKHVDDEEAAASSRELLTVGLPLLSVAISGLVLLWSDTIMLGIFKDTEAVGIYTIALRISMVLAFVLTSMNTLLAPRFSVLYTKKKLAELNDLFAQSTLLMGAMTVPLYLVIIVFATPLLGFFGAEFETGRIALILLATGQLVNVLAGPVGYVLSMTNYEVTLAKVTVIVAVMNIALNAALIPPLGIEGAAIATAASLAIRNITLAIIARSKLGLRFSKSARVDAEPTE